MKRKRQTNVSNIKSFFSLSSPSSLSTTSTCPVCNKKYHDEEIEKHTAQCIERTMSLSNNDNNDTITSSTNNAFSILIKASKKMAIPTLVYILDIVDNKLICSIDHYHHHHDRCTSKEYYNESFTLNNFPNSDKKMKVRLHLSSNIKPISSSSSTTTSSSSSKLSSNDNDHIHTSIIKSMIQKGVRRGMTKEVLKLSNLLSINSLEDFLRRIPIIILEDVILHPAYPILVWVMLAQSKSYKVPLFLVRICILVMGEVSLVQERDIYPDTDSNVTNDANVDNSNVNHIVDNNDNSDTSNVDVNVNLNVNDKNEDEKHDTNNENDNSNNHSNNDTPDNDEKTLLQQLLDISNNSHKTTLLSMIFRFCYGGMKGDMEMLKEYMKTWHSRFSIDSNSNADTFAPNLVMRSYLHDRYLMEFGNLNLLTLFPSTDIKTTDNNAKLLDNLTNIIMIDIKNYFNHENNPSNPVASNDKEIPTVLNLTASSDLNIFGIDHICDSGLVPYIQNLKRDEITECLANAESEYNNVDAIKECIWLFRSSINNRKIWNVLSDAETKGQKKYNQNQLIKKKKMASLWKLITPFLNTYCDTRLRLLWKKIEKTCNVINS